MGMTTFLSGSSYRSLTTGNVGHYLSACAKSIVSAPRDCLAKAIATQFFYVLTTSGKKEELKEEQDLHTRFWKTEEAAPPFRKEVLNYFYSPREEPIEVTLKNGKKVTYIVS